MRKILTWWEYGDIIEVGGGNVIEQEDREESRYGKDKTKTIDHTYIESGAYRRKFDNISNNKELNKNLYQSAKKMLFHRSGTDFEDMYWFDGDTGKEFASITDMQKPSKVDYTPEFVSRHKDIHNKVTIHNHPRSMPPSMGDFQSAYDNGYALGIIAAHDGTVYTYRNIIDPQPELYTTLTADYKSMGFSDFTAEQKALDEMMSRGYLEYREVNTNASHRR
jgi:hypothetical protein